MSTSGMRGLLLPSEIKEVVICLDDDEPGERAARRLGMRLLTEDRRVWLARAGKGVDFNDLLCGVAG